MRYLLKPGDLQVLCQALDRLRLVYLLELGREASFQCLPQRLVAMLVEGGTNLRQAMKMVKVLLKKSNVERCIRSLHQQVVRLWRQRVMKQSLQLPRLQHLSKHHPDHQSRNPLQRIAKTLLLSRLLALPPQLGFRKLSVVQWQIQLPMLTTPSRMSQTLEVQRARCKTRMMEAVILPPQRRAMLEKAASMLPQAKSLHQPLLRSWRRMPCSVRLRESKRMP